MKYIEIDLDTWERDQMFLFYIDNLRSVMSMTVAIDVTSLKTFVKARGLKFYPTMSVSASGFSSRNIFSKIPSFRHLRNQSYTLCQFP